VLTNGSRRVDEIIKQASDGSKFYLKEQARNDRANKVIDKMLRKLNQATPGELKLAESRADKMLNDMRGSITYDRLFMHVDMDAFYAAVEERDDPSLVGKPMAVGGTAMLTTSNYEARKYGVRAAMPGFVAKKLCPNLIIVPCHFDKYVEASKHARSVFTLYDGLFGRRHLLNFSFCFCRELCGLRTG
jgi:DNA polymerase kappa